MDVLVSILRFIGLFIEVFIVFLTMLFMIGATMETPFAAIGLVMGIGGLIYAILKREEDFIDRYFYYSIGVIVCYAFAFFLSR